MFSSDIKKLKYWRTKYLLESIWVAICAISVIVAAYLYIEYWGFCFLVILAVVAIVFLMLRALREELQTRAEMLILEKHKNLLENIHFDVGGGIETEKIMALNVVDKTQSRDCFTVLKTDRYIWEEDLFYKEHSFKYFSIRNTAFRGILFAVKAERAFQDTKADGVLVGKNMLITGNLKSFLVRCDAEELLVQLLKMFGVSKVTMVSMDGWIYFWVKTSKRLFYQFSLLQEVSPLPFVSRMEQLKDIADKFTEAFSI